MIALTYHLLVRDWLGLRDFTEGVLAERDVTVPPATPVEVALGAGCITGRFTGGSSTFLERPTVTAVPREPGKLARRTRCDEQGHFCLRYLDQGVYDVLGHDPKAGWARVEGARVKAEVIDVGERKFAPGGAVRGAFSFSGPCPVPDELVTTGPPGVALRVPFENYSGFDHFELGGLWPGTWSFRVRCGREDLAAGEVQIVGTGKVDVRFPVKAPERR